MSITIQQLPTSPNLVNNDLLYVCTSNKTSEAQMQFVCDIKDKDNNLIQRIKQQPNPSNKAVFNVGQIMTGYFSYTDRIWETAIPAPNTGSGLDFNVVFGEEYASSVSSSVELYDGIQNATTGSPALSGSDYLFDLYGVNESPYDLQSWNWNSGSKYQEEITDDITFNHQFGLTNFSTQSVYTTDYHTISLLNGNVDGGANKTGSAQDVYAVRFKQYNSAGTLLSTEEQINETLRSNPIQLWSQVYTSQSQATRLTHFGVGPQNIADDGIVFDSSTAYYDVIFHAQATDGAINEDGIWGTYRFNVGDCSGFTPQRFAWKNIYGVWDYYNFTKAENVATSIQRKEYTQTFVDYSTTTNSVPYDIARRGRVNHYNDVTKQRQANSDWLNQSDADNLREMFFSADVYLYEPSYGWVPVVITDASITERTNDLSQKTFQYAVNYNMAVGQYSRQ